MLQIKDYKITWRHKVHTDVSNKMDAYSVQPPNQKAQTYCFLRGDNMRPIVGIAECAWGDNFDRDVGRKLSLKRAMADAKLSKEDRTKIWEEYRWMTPKPRW